MIKKLFVGSLMMFSAMVTPVMAAESKGQVPNPLPTLSPTEEIKPGMVRIVCFKQTGDYQGFEVQEKLNKKQLDLLSRIKAPSNVINRIRLNYSIENRVKSCLNRGIPINGYSRKPNPNRKKGFINSIYTILPYNVDMTLVGDQTSFTPKNNIQVKVKFDPFSGYSTSVNEIDNPQ